jgi:hypothetical protein
MGDGRNATGTAGGLTDSTLEGGTDIADEDTPFFA